MDITQVQKEIEALSKQLDNLEKIKHVSRIETQLPTSVAELSELLNSLPLNGLLVAKNEDNQEVIYQKIYTDGQYTFDQISYTSLVNADTKKWSMYIDGTVPESGDERQQIIDSLQEGGIVIDNKRSFGG